MPVLSVKPKPRIILIKQVGADLIAQCHKHGIAGIGDGLHEILAAVIIRVNVAPHGLDARQGVISHTGEAGIFADESLFQPDRRRDGFKHRTRLVKVGNRFVPVLLVAGFDHRGGLLIP